MAYIPSSVFIPAQLSDCSNQHAMLSTPSWTMCPVDKMEERINICMFIIVHATSVAYTIEHIRTTIY